ncbi:alpha/beta fold hydrolase [Streptomyces sp. rh34]|uniref:alpha/beta fold hydrolase n=1 Tax=Streptomyces sp. rh34 TaxID=2034272 RepID=UPI000BF2359D|nr:alpha/beta fold hydrolase [Streptomyces sp. rh34]
MVPRLVFVHGIGPLRDTERELASWIDSLARGMRAAGHSAVAERLAGADAGICSFVNYADLYAPPEAQGSGGARAEGEASELLAELLVELVAGHTSAHPTSEGPHDRERQHRAGILAHARAEAGTRGQAQGSLAVLRRALNVTTTLMSLKPWGGVAHRVTPKLMVNGLTQVSRYLARGEQDASGLTLDSRVRNRVHEALGDGPAVVVAHSLGTVVALEALHERQGTVPLLVTLGSPISMRTVVRPRLLPQPPRTPERVERWLNFWDKDDIIAVRPLLERDVLPNTSGVLPRSSRIDSDGIWVHSAEKYLAQAAVAGPVAEALTVAERRSAS